ncbi:MAG: helix-turn-helix domain-containing protein [Ruminococcus sp.]|nr:helix-turn-helix domain-containing protein [Ruminococcus sp.]
MIYGNKLKELRENKDVLQEELCEILNIKKSAYSQYESEYTIIPIKHLNSLCNYFNVSLDYIFNLTNEINYDDYSKDINKKLSGERLKEFRKDNNFTLEKLGKILNISYGTLAGYEIGRRIIATPFLYTICSKYHISADYLLGKVDEPKYLKKL